MANLFKVLEEKIVWTKNWQNCPFKSEGESKTFPDKQKLRHFIIIRPALQEMLKSILQGNMKGHQTGTQSHTKKKRMISIKLNTGVIMKVSIIGTTIYNFTLCFIHDLKDKCTFYKLLVQKLLFL